MLRSFALKLPSWQLSLGLLTLVACGGGAEPAPSPPPAKAAKAPAPRVLFLLTSHAQLGNTGKPTGAYLGEVTHAHRVFADAGCTIGWASVMGGKVPLDGVDRKDPVNAAFLDDPATAGLLEHTLPAQDIDPSGWDAIYLPGGHGTMFDLRRNEHVARLLAAIHDQGGVVGAVCHGPAGLLDVKTRDGRLLVAGRQVTGFTNEEERAVKLEQAMPFLLEDELQKQGGTFQGAPAWQPNVVVDGRLVTGQNPASAKGVAERMVELLRQRASK